MPNWTVGVPAATAVVGYDLFSSEAWARSQKNRLFMGFALTGSAVIGDTEVDLFVGEVWIGTYFNSALLTPQVNRDLFPVEGLPIGSGTLLRALVQDAPATSILYALASLRDIGR